MSLHPDSQNRRQRISRSITQFEIRPAVCLTTNKPIQVRTATNLSSFFQLRYDIALQRGARRWPRRQTTNFALCAVADAVVYGVGEPSGIQSRGCIGRDEAVS